jgi:arylsulfatase A
MPRRSYARVVATVDSLIGRILKQLDESGIRDDTIIIFSSDNGHSEEDNKGVTVQNHSSGYPVGYYYLANGGGGYTGKWIGHKGNYFEGGVRIPAIISYPKQLPQGTVRDQVVTVMDWMPTLIDLIGLPKPKAPLDGQSMMSVINNPTAPTQHPVLYFDWQDRWAVREGDWKLISQVDGRTKKRNYTLHNLAEAHPEVKDHAKEQPALVAHLKTLHADWERDVKPHSSQ